jgi:GTP cyclohydrolase II
MLGALGIQQIRILSGNPDKAAQLEQYGVIIREIVPMERHETDDNKNYRAAKENAGHRFKL